MKKTIKMLATFAVMFMAVSTMAHAQGRAGGRPSAATILKDSLHVSDAVAAKADSIVKAYAAKNQELRAQQTNDIKALLNDEQKAAFDKIMAAMPQGRRGGGR